MKTKILSILSGTLVLILSACSTDLVPEPDSPSGKGDSILRLDIQKQDLTRGVITSTSFEKDDKVFVIVRDTQHPDPLTFTSLATYDGSEWIFEEKIDLSSMSDGIAWTSAEVEVYYPYQTFYQAYDPKNSTRFIMNDPLDQEDILYGRAIGINAENPTAKVSCNHLKTRLTFELKNTSDTPIGISKMSVTTEGQQLFLGRYGYVMNGYFEIPDEYTNDYSLSCNIEIPAGETANLDLLIPPTEQAYEMMEYRIMEEGISKTTLKFSLDSSDRTINFDIDAAAWKPGMQYIYPVNITSKESIGKPIESITISGVNSDGVALKDDLMVLIQNTSNDEWYGPYTAVYDESINNYVINDFSFTLKENAWYAVFAVSGNTRYDGAGLVLFSEGDYNVGMDQTPIYWGTTEIGWDHPHLSMELSEWTGSITVVYPAQWGEIKYLSLEDENRGLPGNLFNIRTKQNRSTSPYYMSPYVGSILNMRDEYQLTFNIFPTSLTSEYCTITLPLESGNRKFTCPDLNVQSGQNYVIRITSDGLAVLE